MRRVTVNSRGEVRPERINVNYKDNTRVVFDFGLLMPSVDSYSVEGDARVKDHSKMGSRITVDLNESQACRLYDLVVVASGNGETRAATVQIKTEDRRRGWNSFTGRFFGGYWP